MSESSYYWAIIGRILFDDEDTIYCTDLPTTQSDACDQFHRYMQEEDPDRYHRHGVILTTLLRSTDCIEIHD